MTVHINGSKGKELYYNGVKIKEAYYNGNKVYSGKPLYYCYTGYGQHLYSQPNDILTLYYHEDNPAIPATQSSQLKKYYWNASSGDENYIIMPFGNQTYRYDRYPSGDLYT